MITLRMVVNGQPVELASPAERPLSEILRYELGLTGTKIGCEEGRCGSCMVLVNGKPTQSCILTAQKAQGAEVLTIEGLSKDGGLHPLQQAFIQHGAFQCGFCTPGFIISAYALLQKNPDPSRDEIRAALRHNLCRCTGYNSIIRAVEAAVAKMRGETPPAPLLPITPSSLRVIGQPLARPDAAEMVTGALSFADDITFVGLLHGATLRAGLPHARIRSISTEKAAALPGVHAVLTHRDVPGGNRHGLVYPDWPVLCDDKVRYAGDAVAIVAAETGELARQALGLIEVEYDLLPVVADAVAARQPDAPRVHEDRDGNVLEHLTIQRGDLTEGFALAEMVIERTYQTPSAEHAFLEPECSIGRISEDGRIEVYVGSQIPYADRKQIAEALNVPEEGVRVIGAAIGGGFGGKEDITSQIHSALLARVTGRPVKMLYSRAESLLVHPKRHAMVIHITIGARRDGRITAFRAELIGDTGAYASLGPKVMARALSHAAGPYEIPNLRIDCDTVYTNNPPSGAFRGFGVSQPCFSVESALDELAQALQIDSIELRRKNLLRVGSTTCTGQVLRESVGLEECLDRVVTALRAEQGLDEEQPLTSAWQKGEKDHLPLVTRHTPLRWAWREGAKAYGWGLALAFKNTGLGGGATDAATAEVDLTGEGGAVVRIAAADMGQGLPAVLAAIVAEEVGVPYKRVTVLRPDTDRTPDGGPTTASRQTFISGNAVRGAAIQLRERLAALISERLDIPPAMLHFHDGMITGEGKEISLAEAVCWAQEEGHSLVVRHRYEAPRTQPIGEGGDTYIALSFSAQAALVEVDTTSGKVAVKKVIAAHDVGRAINPLTLKGQVEGGIVMGLGLALSEEFIVRDGLPQTKRLTAYRIPGILQIPEILSFIVEHPTCEGPYGAKGIGELSILAIVPAITNAIYNAVSVRVRNLPVNTAHLMESLA